MPLTCTPCGKAWFPSASCAYTTSRYCPVCVNPRYATLYRSVPASVSVADPLRVPEPVLLSDSDALRVPDAGTQLHVLRADRNYLLISVMGLGDGNRSYEVATRLAHAFGPKRVGGRRHGVIHQFNLTEESGTRHEVIHETAREHLAALRVVVAVLEQRLPQALRDAAVRLAIDDLRTHGTTDVIHGRVAHEFIAPRLRIDLEFDDVTASAG